MKTIILTLLLLSSSAHAEILKRLIPAEVEAEVFAFKFCNGWNFKIYDSFPLDDWKLVTFKCTARKGKSK